MSSVAEANLESQRAWDGVLFDRFVRYRAVVIDGLTPHGSIAIERHPPPERARVLDVGCGFGDSAQHLAQIVGPQGEVLGVDIAPRFVEAARAEAADAGVANARFEVADLQTHEFADRFDYAHSRFGTMFFASPVVALRNVARALAPGGQLVLVVWRRKLDNPWLHVAENVVKPMVDEPEETDEPRCGPGPFSMANADTVADILLAAGFVDVAFERVDLPYRLGRRLEEAVEINLALGPAGEAVRLAGEEADAVRPEIERLLTEALAPYETPDGVILSSSTWTVTASTPR